MEILRKDSSIELIITDDCMPHLDGIQLFHQAQQIERLDDNGNKAVPAFILMVTPTTGNAASSSKKTPQYAKDLGISSVLMKPIKFEELVEVVNALQRRKKPAGPVDKPVPRLEFPEAPKSSNRDAATTKTKSPPPRPNLANIASELRRAAEQLDLAGGQH